MREKKREVTMAWLNRRQQWSSGGGERWEYVWMGQRCRAIIRLEFFSSSNYYY